MDFLRLLEAGRTAFLDVWFSLVTNLGSEMALLAVAAVVYWCISKKNGIYLMCVGFTGVAVNAALKLIFCVPRPWMLDPDFTIVESARAGATGYSLPSGHTQNATGLFGSLARIVKKPALRFFFFLILCLVGFSRMYLGVHTPADVAVSLMIGAILVLVFYPAFQNAEMNPRPTIVALGICVLLSLASALYGTYAPLPQGGDAVLSASVTADAYKTLGGALGLFLGAVLERRYCNFEEAAPLPLQFVKVGVGLALIIGVRAVFKAPLLALFGDERIAGVVRYCIMAFLAVFVYPLAFRLLPVERDAPAAA